MGENLNNNMMYGIGLVAIIALVGLFLSINGMNSRMDRVDNEVSSLSAMVLKNQQVEKAGPTKEVAEESNIFGVDLTGREAKGSGEIVIVEYSDFQCSFCARATPTVKKILEEYGNDVKLYYKHFPLSQIHPDAQKAAEASECAADQGMFWEYHDKLFENQGSLGVSSLKKYAGDLGLNQGEFDSCLDSGEKTSMVQADLKEGASLGVQGTPTFFINGNVVRGAQPYDVFKQAIEAELG